MLGRLQTEFNKFVGLEINCIDSNGYFSLDLNDKNYKDMVEAFNDKGTSYRFRLPGQMITMDHQPNRINVHVFLNEETGKFKVSNLSLG